MVTDERHGEVTVVIADCKHNQADRIGPVDLSSGDLVLADQCADGVGMPVPEERSEYINHPAD